MGKEETTAASEGSETTTGGEGNEGQPTETESVSKSEFDELKTKLESVNAANERLKKNLDSYKSKEQEAKEAARKKAEEDGNHEEQIKFYQEKETELQQQVESLKAELESTVVDSQLLSIAAEIGCAKPEAFIKFYRDRFEIGKNAEGKSTTIVKGFSLDMLKPKEFLSKKLDEEFPEWRKNPRADGTGAGNKPEERNGGGSVTAEKIGRMQPYSDERLAALKDKKARHEMYKRGG